MVNASLCEGHLLVSQKKAGVTPLLKKSSSDIHDLKNYRPVSNLSFVSKLVERAAVKQLVDYLEVNELLPKLQSAYRKHHSTETAVLRVLSDILTAIDNQQMTLLALLDSSAAFDCVDHEILLSRRQSSFSLGGTTLTWIWSFLTDRSQRVLFNGSLSVETMLLFGVPQGSVLGPLLFCCMQHRSLTSLHHSDCPATPMLMIPGCTSACRHPNHRWLQPSWLHVSKVLTNGWSPTD